MDRRPAAARLVRPRPRQPGRRRRPAGAGGHPRLQPAAEAQARRPGHRPAGRHPVPAPLPHRRAAGRLLRQAQQDPAPTDGAALRRPLRRRSPAALRAAGGRAGMAAHRPLQVAREPLPALRPRRDPRPQAAGDPERLPCAAAPRRTVPRRRRRSAGHPGRRVPQARRRRQRGPQVRPARGHRAAGQRGRVPAHRRARLHLHRHRQTAGRGSAQRRVRTPGLSADLPVLHRGPPGAGLCAHQQERCLHPRLQPRAPARPDADGPAHHRGPAGQLFR